MIGYIYKLIVENHPELIYIGSTIKPLQKRLSNHKSMYKRGETNYSSFQLFETGEEVKIELLEEVDFEDVAELREREDYHICNTSCCINKRRALRTDEDNKEYYKQYHKERYKNNKEEIKEQKKEYYENNREKRKEQMKQYYENNKEKMKEQMKQYKENNREKIREYKREYYRNKKNGSNK